MRSESWRWWIPGVFAGLVMFALPPIARGAVAGLDSVIVVPNPYNASGRTFGPQSDITGYERIRFANVPPPATIRIYTSAGTLVATLEHTQGDQYLWGGRNSDNQYIVSDVYIYVIEHATYGRKIGKFVVIR